MVDIFLGSWLPNIQARFLPVMTPWVFFGGCNYLSPLDAPSVVLKFEVAHSSLAWDELSVLTTVQSVGLGRGGFYLIFAMNNVKIKD